MAAGASPGPVTVVVEADDPEAARAAVADAGGRVVREAGGLVKADVRPDRLAALAGADGVRRVSEPRPVLPDVTSEGITGTQSAAWQSGGFGGSGTRVAIIDGGFTGYAARIGTAAPGRHGRRPDPVRRRRRRQRARHRGRGDRPRHRPGRRPPAHLHRRSHRLHRCARRPPRRRRRRERLLRLHPPRPRRRLRPGVGGGRPGPDRGVLYVAAAGNSESTHRHQNATGDAAGNDFDDFVNLPGGDDALAFGVAPGGQASVSLQWDAWPTTALDFDLYIVTNEDPFPVAESIQVQNGNDPPIEGTFVNNPSGVEQDLLRDHRPLGRVGNASARPVLQRRRARASSRPPAAPSPIRPSRRPPSRWEPTATPTCAAEPYSSRGPDDRRADQARHRRARRHDEQRLRRRRRLHGLGLLRHVRGGAARGRRGGPGARGEPWPRRRRAPAAPRGPRPRRRLRRRGQHLRIGAAAPRADRRRHRRHPAGLHGHHARAPVRQSRRAALPVGEPRPHHPSPGGQGARPGRARSPASPPTPPPSCSTSRPWPPARLGTSPCTPAGRCPTASNLNFAKGQTVAVHVTATVGRRRQGRASTTPTGSTHVIVDLAGWYGPTGSGGPSTRSPHAAPAPGRAHRQPARPARLRGGRLRGERSHHADRARAASWPSQVAGLGGVPAEATAVVMNVTAVAPSTQHLHHRLPGRAGRARRPRASTSRPGQTVANLVVVPVGAGRRGPLLQRGRLTPPHRRRDRLVPARGGRRLRRPRPTDARPRHAHSGTGLRRGAARRRRHAQAEGRSLQRRARRRRRRDARRRRRRRRRASGYLTVYPGSAVARRPRRA